MENNASAISPENSCVVSASAGTGKTWLLVSRIVRLLLHQTSPGNIVAITFTRKAAAEMQTRLANRLRELATCSEQQLDSQLRGLNIEPDKVARQNARRLYEQLLHTPFTVRTTTFHAFCQEILRRFPLEANIPPGFELIEQSRAMQLEAWDVLFAENTNNEDPVIASALKILFEYCGSLANTKSALLGFIEKRIDWYMLTANQVEPVAFAVQRLRNQYQLTAPTWKASDFFNDSLINHLDRFSTLLALHDTKTNLSHVDILQAIQNLIKVKEYDTAFDNISSVFLTKTDETPLKRKESKTQAKAMGEEGQQQFLDIHHRISTLLLDEKDKKQRYQNLQANQAWYTVGNYLLSLYQQLKQDQRVLDFDDLEWITYQLLHHSEAATWIQYKLDARIDHLLIDEFQDTNPIQWRLLLPLLEELAAGNTDRNRSVFLVGDKKQSIYGFRRAEPKLFSMAQHWLTENLQAVVYPLATSWRSSTVLMDFVNLLFSEGPLATQLPDFPVHTTHHTNLYGKVEILPLLKADEFDALELNTEFRNPLLQPRNIRIDTRHYREGQLIAKTIRTLIDNQEITGQGKEARPLDFKDFIILVRSRTHAADYEHALREADIPYLGNDNNSLLASLETLDMIALLQTLVTPYNNLAVAHVLRSPIFNSDENDLQQLVGHTSTWFETLTNNDWHNNPTLHRAKELLARWLSYAGLIPVHDILDKIYHEGNLLYCYLNAAPSYLHNRIRANLQQFLELALDMDSGRYPSMERFLWELQQAKADQIDIADQATLADASTSVRIMTIHSAKGLESPVVFLADSSRTPKPHHAYQPIIHWPVENDHPESFFLIGDKTTRDRHAQMIRDRLNQDELREEANLLYVAVTRAKQYLYITGTESAKDNGLGWYGAIVDQCQQQGWGKLSLNNGIVCEGGTKLAPSQLDTQLDKQINTASKVDLSQTHISPPNVNYAKMTDPVKQISPSYQTAERQPILHQSDKPHEEDVLRRGRLLHRAIELLSNKIEYEQVVQRLNNEFGIDRGSQNIDVLDEAVGVYTDKRTKYLFDDNSILHAFNEIPLFYQQDAQTTVSGIIDRLIVYQNRIVIIDYKTHRITDPQQLAALAEHYRPQMALYVAGVKKIWPDQPVESLLLFTYSRYITPSCIAD